MQYPLKMLIPALAFLLLAACGGGTNPPGGSSNPTPTPAPNPNPTPSSLPPASISFISATPSILGPQNSGKATTSYVVFKVADKDGNPVADGIRVNFNVNNIAKQITPNADTSGGTGEVTATVDSGAVAGTIIVKATVDGYTDANSQPISTQTTHISVGGGVAEQGGLTLAPATINIPGLKVVGVTDQITALLADHFNNYDIMSGSAVNFYTSAGGIQSGNFTDDTGKTSVLLRTQNPLPANVTITQPEIDFINQINGFYNLAIPTDGSVNPRNGWVSIIATTGGQETFNDMNANGAYDVGTDGFTTADDIGEPYADANNNGQFDPGEYYIDINKDNKYNDPNTVWDGPGCTDTNCQSDKTIYGVTTVVFTGDGQYCAFGTGTNPLVSSIQPAASQTYKFMVGDQNLNALAPGTTIKITATAGKLSGVTDYTVPDGLSTGPTQFSFTLENNNTTGSPVVSELKATVTGPAIQNQQIIGCPGNFPISLNVTLPSQ